MAIFMQWDGGSIKGNVTAEGYTDWIKLENVQFGVGRGITMEAGNMSNREATRPSISEVSISKVMDGASSGLFQESLVGADGKKVVISVVKTGADKVEEYVKYELENALFSSYSMSAGDSGPPFENLAISFSKISMIYTAADKANAAGNQGVVGYDLELGKKV
ncbi:MAG: type VI secretion system tube protein Hcp [Pseudomonadales bacterium]|uniref:Hemolysin-coregulated protein n=1 Tax=Oleiphilus messinensis TaxID=141451 RepID=A0A1Y0I437_9GAMM|nr:type VI secretion system tube protein Hcp [Oleiphilus messinensis]ARU54969.1 hemolysin-coregulated protein [Oleiphilus messinensis]MCG8608973.1 type VI secretion system tube protein Hcp [Pseudomonadales bacterium]